MERRDFLKFGLGLMAVSAFAASASAAPVSPHVLHDAEPRPERHPDAHPAVTSREEVDRIEPEQVHWRHRHWGWRHRHWRHRHWHRRHWGWHRHHWHRRHW